jgi:glutathione S-transferase
MVKLHKGENYSPEYKAINPHGQVPVLVDGDQVITQIVAVVSWLDDRFPQCNFLPREPLARIRVLETLAWMNNTVHPTFTHVFMPHKFAATPEAQADIKAFNAVVRPDAGWVMQLRARPRTGCLICGEHPARRVPTR